MIPCNHCGVVNPLGTLFCRSCGQRIEIDPSQVMASVEQSRSEHAGAQMMQAGRSALTMCGFLLMAALIVNVVVIPKLPPASMPMAAPRSGSDLLPSVERTGPAGPAEVTLAVSSGSGSILDWRRSNGDHLIGSFGTDLEQILKWMQVVVEGQREDGSFLGKDPIVATSLSVLALQAWPGDRAADRAASRGSDWLYARRDRILEIPDRRAQSLLAMALLESGRLNRQELAAMASLVGSGDETRWQALTLPLFAPADRPRDLLVLRRQLGEDPLWQHYLDRFTSEPLVDGPDPTLFSAAGVVGLDPFQRWVWSQTAWFHAADPQTYAATMRSWSAAEHPPAAPEPLATDAGPQSGAALAILAVCAAARVPITSADPQR